MRRLVFVGVMILFVVVPIQTASAQRNRMMRTPMYDPNRITPGVDRSIQVALTEAQSLIEQKQYAEAVTRLQSVLDYPEDFFVGKDFKPTGAIQGGVKAEVNRKLANLSTEGLAAYELHIGTSVRSLLNDVVKANDYDKLTEIVSRYQMTSAGFDAMQLLVAYAFDHDELIEAARLCERMLTHPRATAEVTGPLLLRTAFAWYLAGQPERSHAAIKRLVKLESPTAWKIAGRPIESLAEDGDLVAWCKKHFGPQPPPRSLPVRDWDVPRGGVTGNEVATAACAVGGGDWSVSMLKTIRLQGDAEANQKLKDAFDRSIRQLQRSMNEDNRTIVLSGVPLVAKDTVIYRTLNDVTAVDLRTGEMRWRSSLPDGMLKWFVQSSNAELENEPVTTPVNLRWYLRFKLYRDQLSGLLSTDGKNVYAVEESDSQFEMSRLPRQRLGEPMSLGTTNKLVAYELNGGRIAWVAGGPRGTPPVDLSGVFFLGPPVPYEGRLYCLVEVRDELHLLALFQDGKSVQVEWSQALVATQESGAFPSTRRQSGLMPVVSAGMIVCPLAGGAIVAFDLRTQQLEWGYSYEVRRSRMTRDGFDMVTPVVVEDETGRWVDGSPLVENGRVIVTPRDSEEVHCLDLIDGRLLWKRPRDYGLYVACITSEAVVVVRRSQVVAYSLADGTEFWSEPIEIPEPSGRGVRVGSRYLLPLSTGEIATLDLASGRVLGRSRLPNGQVPGSLVVGSETLVSRGLHELIGFRSQSRVESLIAQRLSTNPKDAEALALRGELRLHNGETQSAILDLRESLRQKADPRVKQVLAGTLLSSLAKDLPQFLLIAPELETLTEDPDQRIEFLRLYVQALTQSGDRVGVVKQLFRLAAIRQLRDEPTKSSPGYSISPRQKIRSQLLEMYEQSTFTERGMIVSVFEAELEAALRSTDRDANVASFVRLTEGHPAANSLLRRLIESDFVWSMPIAKTRVLEQLTKSRDKTIAAFATARLASQALADKSPLDALGWIDDLRGDLASQPALGKQTGRDLANSWSSREDVRQAMLPPYEWPSGDIDLQREPTRIGRSGFPVDVVTQVGRHFQGWSFEVDSANGQLIARDASLRTAWELPMAPLAEIPLSHPSLMHIRGRYLVITAGAWLAVLESTNSNQVPTLLYEKSLRATLMSERRRESTPERRLLPNGRLYQSISDARGPAGFLIGLSDEAIFYQMDSRLYAADLNTGDVLWHRVGSEFARSDATVDTSLVLHASNNDAILVNPLDGTVRARRKGWLEEKIIWFRGTRRLSLRTEGLDQRRVFEMRDVETDRIIWQTSHPAGTTRTIVGNDEIALLEPTGKLTILHLDSGDSRMSTDVPITRTFATEGVLAVQKYADQYIVIGGTPSKRLEVAVVTPLEFGPASEMAFTVDGVVCGCDQKSGRVNWSMPVAQLAFNRSQMANQPVLVLAARQGEIERQATHSLSAVVLDKRTGKLIYETQEPLPLNGRGVQIVPMVDDQKVIVDFQLWSLELGFGRAAK